MRKLKIITIAFWVVCLFISCSKGDDNDSYTYSTMPELRWVEGNYTGTYCTSKQYYRYVDGKFQYDTPIESRSEVKAKVSLNPDITLTILVRGGYNVSMTNKEFTVSEKRDQVKCGIFTFNKESQSMYYYNTFEHFDKSNNGQFHEYNFSAYKDIEK